jgi:hypothetical protein
MSRRNIIAFKDFVQYVGPPMAYYERQTEQGNTEHIERFTYQPFGWQSDDPAKIIARLEAFRLARQALITWKDDEPEEEGKAPA